MAYNIVEDIRKKSKEEYHKEAIGCWATLRSWLQEHGEFAFIGGAVLGVLVVCFPKIVVGLVAVAVILAFVVYQIAFSENRPVEGQVVETTSSSDASKKKNEGKEGSEEHVER
ncbi:hypothetical protein OAO01_00780 [Oligoflexia bacterium]|nr:hypothetical protein [Oligoflexia bacterium]